MVDEHEYVAMCININKGTHYTKGVMGYLITDHKENNNISQRKENHILVRVGLIPSDHRSHGKSYIG